MRRLLFNALTSVVAGAMLVGLTPIDCGSVLADKTSENDVNAFVERGYDLILDRESDEEGLKYWTDNLLAGEIDAADMITMFVESPEYQSKNATNEDQVKVLYNVMLNREADEEGMAYWVDLLDTGFSHRMIVNGFANSPEFNGLCDEYGIEAGMVNFVEPRDLNMNMTKFVSNCYTSVLERKADASGLNFWITKLMDQELYPEEILTDFIGSEECAAKVATDEGFVDTLYRAFFGHNADPQGQDFWLNYLGEHSRDEVFAQFTLSEEFSNLLNECQMTLRPTPTPTPTPEPTPVPGKMIALTFDDGPYSPVTNRILDLLEQYGGHATFFVVGDRVPTYNSTVLRAESLGCEIANHTYDHKSTLTSMSADSVVWEISNCNQSINNSVGHYPSIMRPVGGAYNSTVAANVGLPMIIWSIDTQDWKYRDATHTANAILNNPGDGNIVLMHDLYSSTADAMEVVIPELARQGYQFVTVSELAAAKGYSMSAGSAYYSFK